MDNSSDNVEKGAVWNATGRARKLLRFFGTSVASASLLVGCGGGAESTSEDRAAALVSSPNGEQLGQATAELIGRVAEVSTDLGTGLGTDLAADTRDIETILLDSVRELVMAERHDEAREVLESRLQEAPEDTRAALMLSAVDILDEEYEAAYDLAQTWLGIAPNQPLLIERSAVAAFFAQDLDAARTEFEALADALGGSERSAELCDPMPGLCAKTATWRNYALAGLATTQFQQGEVEQAEALANTQIQIGMANPTLDVTPHQFVLAMSAARRGDLDRAQELYEAILEVDPSSNAVLNNLGTIHYDRHDLDTARSYYLQAYEHSGIDRRGAAIAWLNVAEVDMLRGDLQASEDKLLEALATSERYPGTYLSLAVLYDVLGQPRKSMEYLKTGLEMDVNAVTRSNMGFYTPDWRTHFEALVAQATGDTSTAAAKWLELVDSDVELLAASAKRHAGLRTAVR